MPKFAVTFQEIYTYTVNITADNADEARIAVQFGNFDREIQPDQIDTNSSEDWEIEPARENHGKELK